MNQLEELKKKIKTDTSGKWVQIEELDLFAELIVKECEEVLLKWKVESFPFDEDLAVSLIKEHFGVRQ
jgi:hypothetical protein